DLAVHRSFRARGGESACFVPTILPTPQVPAQLLHSSAPVVRQGMSVPPEGKSGIGVAYDVAHRPRVRPGCQRPADKRVAEVVEPHRKTSFRPDLGPILLPKTTCI